MRTNETAPVSTGAASGSLAAAKPLSRSRLLGCDPYPDVTAVYGLEVRDVR